MLDAGIIGGSGYTGGELIRLLCNHPDVNVKIATSRSFSDRKVSDVHKHLKGFTDIRFQNLTPQKVKSECDVIFAAVPHGASMDVIPEIVDENIKVIDLSADYRLDTKIFESVYGMVHKDPRKATYGLVELHPEVADEDFVANPGCYPTGAILSAAPLASEKLIETAIFDSKSGITGAGISPSKTSHYPNLAENIVAYKLTTHRHKAEIVQELERLDHNINNISFTPHVIPSIRGILTTSHLFLKENMEYDDIMSIYQQFYKDNKFIRMVEDVPSLGGVRGSNFCDIGFEVDSENRRLVVISAIDNLVKGASGQAIQNMNLMCGFEETTGLWVSGISP